MPIKFRCAYCNQLLGIARRKAGTVVRCPNCAGQVIVPKQEEDDEDKGAAESDEPEQRPEPVVEKPAKGSDKPAKAPEKPPKVPDRPAAGQVFEHSDFDNLLKPMPTERAPGGQLPSPPPVRVKADKGESEINVERIPEPAGGALGSDVAMAPMPGIWLSPAKATLLSVLAVLALTLAFVVGLMVGLFFRPAQRDVREEQRKPLDGAVVRMV